MQLSLGPKAAKPSREPLYVDQTLRRTLQLPYLGLLASDQNAWRQLHQLPMEFLFVQ
jgi:hypothetical protein